MASDQLTQLVGGAFMVLIPMILSLTVHEYSHAFAARQLGDKTAESLGRLTLNPLAHADPFGTILLPLFLLLLSGGTGMGRIPFFGWAKPVPIDPSRFTRKISPRTGDMIVAAAGPASNLLLALICAGILSIFAHGQLPLDRPIQEFLIAMMYINVALFVFNMIPIYPLDGQKVVSGLLKGATAYRFDQLNRQFGTMALWVLIIAGRDFISWPVRAVSSGVLVAVGLG